MRGIMALALIAVVACGGKLSDEQRKKMREQMELREIRRVTETQITEAAFSRGRAIISAIGSAGDSTQLDSLLRAYEGRVRWITPGDTGILPIEQQLLEAYQESSSEQPDNVQKIRTADGDSDSLLYTKPVMVAEPHGASRLSGVWNVWLSKKQLILSMDKK